MPNDLSAQIRGLVDSVEPVSPSEAIALAERNGSIAHSPPLGAPVDASFAPVQFAQRTRVEGPDEIDVHRRSWTRRRLLTVGTSAAIVAGLGLAWGLAPSSPTTSLHRHASRSGHRSVILTAAEVRTIVAHSAAVSASGTALVTEASAEDGTPQSDSTVAVTFDGANIDELITVHPEPPGSAPTFTTDDRLVDGQFYIDTPGPNGVTEWQHDTNSADDLASMQFPDPRTLYAALSPSARFEVVGSTTSDGTTLTRLRALDPSAMATDTLGGLAGGSLSSLEITVGKNNVVQQMTFSSTQTERVCRFTGTSQQLEAELEKNAVSITSPGAVDFSELEKQGVIALAKSDDGKSVRVVTAPATKTLATCGPATWSSDVSVTFANLGAPESVTAPQGAVNFQGKG